MKILIACSEPKDTKRRAGAFQRVFDSAWADRFIKQLRNEREFCTGCGDRCLHCRDWRVPDFSEDIVGIIRFPSILPELLDDPAECLPKDLPPHDALVAIEIHEELLIELPKLAKAAGAKAMIAPVEAPEWVTRWGKDKLKAAAKQLNLEIAVPKPFCALVPGSGPTLDAFIEQFRIGRPVVEIEELDGRVAKAIAKISAPCGNSHYVAHSLQGHFIDETLQFEVCRYWHSYPCTGSMKKDPELGGDTILHKGGQIHMECFCGAAGVGYGGIAEAQMKTGTHS